MCPLFPQIVPSMNIKNRNRPDNLAQSDTDKVAWHLAGMAKHVIRPVEMVIVSREKGVSEEECIILPVSIDTPGSTAKWFSDQTVLN